MQLAEEDDRTGRYTAIHTCDDVQIEADVGAEAIDTQSDDGYTGSRNGSRGKGLLSTVSTYTTTSFEEVTGTPAGTAFSTNIDGSTASYDIYNNLVLMVAQVLDTANFHPFDDGLQYSLSLWFLESRLSAAAIDSYLRNEAINAHGFLFQDFKQWISKLESIPYGIHNNTW
jgi:hypothetical protein